jgi:hypothetical protein
MSCLHPHCQPHGRCVQPTDQRNRTIRLTDKGRAAIGVPVLVPVPLLNIPARDDSKDRR